MRNRASLATVCAAFMLTVGTEVYGGSITQFTSRPLFNTAMGVPLTVEDFTPSGHFPIPTGVLNSSTNLPAINLFPGDIQPGVTYSVPITPAPSDFFFNIDSGGGFVGGFLDGLRGDDPNATLTTAFDNPVTGFGFDTNSLMGASFDLTIKFVSGPDFVTNVSNNPGTTDLRFYGFTSSATDILSAEITGTDTIFDFALDNFTFGGIPEPSTLGLACFMLLGLGWRRGI